MKRCRLIKILTSLVALLLAGCGQTPGPGVSSSPPTTSRAGLSIVSGSENKSLEPIIQQFARQQGVKIDITYMGSGTLFDKYLKQGAGAYPIIVAYENQLLEFAADHRELIEPVKKKLRILYPRPTVWAAHPLIALDANGKRLIAALKDREMQRIAWERHGFRSGLMGAVNTASLPILGVPTSIDGVMQLPSLAVMNKLTEALNTTPR